MINNLNLILIYSIDTGIHHPAMAMLDSAAMMSMRDPLTGPSRRAMGDAVEVSKRATEDAVEASSMWSVDLDNPVALALAVAAVAALVIVTTVTTTSVVARVRDLIKSLSFSIYVAFVSMPINVIFNVNYHSLTSPGAGCSIRTTLSQLSKRSGS